MKPPPMVSAGLILIGLGLALFGAQHEFPGLFRKAVGPTHMPPQQVLFESDDGKERLHLTVPLAYFREGQEPAANPQRMIWIWAEFPSLRPWTVVQEETRAPGRYLAVRVSAVQSRPGGVGRRYAYAKEHYAVQGPGAFGLEHFKTPTREGDVFTDGSAVWIYCRGITCSGEQSFRGFQTSYTFLSEGLAEWPAYHKASIELLEALASGKAPSR